MKLQDIKPFWSPYNIEETKMYKFIQHVNTVFGTELKTYNDLYVWSITYIDKFWSTFLIFSGIKYIGSYDQIIDFSVPMSQIPVWFKGAYLNFAENLLFPNSNNLALVSIDENLNEFVFSHKDLYREVSVLFHAFKRYGLKKGDIVASILPNDHRAVICMFAVASLGCIWTSLPCELQYPGMKEKLEQVCPRIIISVDTFLYGGKNVNQAEKMKLLSNDSSLFQKILIYSDNETLISQIPNTLEMKQFFKLYGKKKDRDKIIKFEMVPFNYPLFIMYTSGTTGPAKKLIHSVGGTLIQLVKEHMLHGDVSQKDIIFFLTSPSWMMWNWAVAALFCEAALILYSGSPIKPKPDVIWEIADNYNATVFGAGSAYYKAIEQMNMIPNEKSAYLSLRSFIATGSHLSASSYSYIEGCIKSNVPVSSISGGSDIISAFVGHNPMLPVYAGEIQSINLGMCVKCLDEEGNEIYDDFGELVCTKPFPSMPIGILNDKNNKKYIEAYFSHYNGIWTHGDYCKINSKSGGVSILGRSDATLKINGVRIGTDEIYNILNEIPEIEDSLCIGQYFNEGMERIILFIKHKNSDSFEALKTTIREKIASALTPRHVPAIILPIKDIPYTLTGKKVETLIRNIISKRKHTFNKEALRNPDSLDYFTSFNI